MEKKLQEKGRWIIVANRLPFQFDAKTKKMVPTGGGLVTALQGIPSHHSVVWVGATSHKEAYAWYKSKPKDPSTSATYHPVFLDQALYNAYYNGFCNNTLWPLFHYEWELAHFDPESWKAYQEVNRRFAQVIHQITRKHSNDLIWIHDFHLFLLPKYLKEKNRQLKVGFFLHIPFPSSEIYRHLPVRREILKSLLHADLVGLHDYSYLLHFRRSANLLLGRASSLLSIEHKGHTTHLTVLPVSINTQQIRRKMRSALTSHYMETYFLRQHQRRSYLILGVDRLDYTKGIELKLLAFRQLLVLHPELHSKVHFLQIAVPSRVHVPGYMKLKEEINRLVGEINGEFSTPSYIPIHYIFNSVNFYELLALYRAADVLFIGSKRDGMNLVSLEFVASQEEENPGVVVLSEFAGAISTLAHALRINPWDFARTAHVLYRALRMPLKERQKRHRPLLEFLKGYTSGHWAKTFMRTLEKLPQSVPAIRPIDLSLKKNLRALRKEIHGKRPLIMMDIDATLSLDKVPGDIKQFLKRLQKNHAAILVLISSHTSAFLEKEFMGMDVHLAAENGAKFGHGQVKKWKILVHHDQKIWREKAVSIIKDYTQRTPGSFLEQREFSLCWHYGKTVGTFAKFQARKLVAELEAGSAHFPARVQLGPKSVEIAAIEANKGIFAHWFKKEFSLSPRTLILGVGSDPSNEDLFNVLNSNGITIKLGLGTTHAKYVFPEKTSFLSFFHELFPLSP